MRTKDIDTVLSLSLAPALLHEGTRPLLKRLGTSPQTATSPFGRATCLSMKSNRSLNMAN